MSRATKSKENTSPTANISIEDDADVVSFTTPRKVVEDIIDRLDSESWDENTTFIDIACKTGEFLVAIHDRLMVNKRLCEVYPDTPERSRHIIEKQLYAIVLSGSQKEKIAKRLGGYKNNLIYMYDYFYEIGKLRYGGAYTNLTCEIYKEFNRCFFDVVVGHPPYYEGKDKTGGKLPVYTEFVTFADELVEYGKGTISLIIPCRWYNEIDSKLYSKIRYSLFRPSLKELHDFEDSTELFENVSLVDGLCYYIKNNTYIGKCKVYEHWNNEITVTERSWTGRDPVLIRKGQLQSIVDKVTTECFWTIERNATTLPSFGFNRSYRGELSKSKDEEHSIRLLTSKGIYYIPRDRVKKNCDLVDKYNVYVGYGQDFERYFKSPSEAWRIRSIGILEPSEVCTLTYLVVSSFDTLEEAEQCVKYLKTKFVRALVRANTTTSTLTDSSFKFVPAIETYSDIDIDIEWSKSLAEIDKQLYKIFKLSKEDIDWIEKNIASM